MMLTTLVSVTSIYAIFLCLMMVFLAVSVIKLRVSHRVALSDGGQEDLRVAIRVLGNFSEYVPIALILIAFCELNQAHEVFLHILGFMLVLGRLFHWYGLNKRNIKFRKVGMNLTFLCLIFGAGLLAFTLI